MTKNIFIGYNLKVRPAVKPEDRVVVRVGMVLSSFVGLVRNSILTIVMYCTNTKSPRRGKPGKSNAATEITGNFWLKESLVFLLKCWRPDIESLSESQSI